MRRREAVRTVLPLLLVLAGFAFPQALPSASGEKATDGERWEPLGGVKGGQPATLVIGGKGRDYRHLGPGDSLQFTVTGGEKIRVLVRRERAAGEAGALACEYYLATGTDAPTLHGRSEVLDPSAADESRPGIPISRATIHTLTAPAGVSTLCLSISRLSKYGVYVSVQHPGLAKAPVHWKFGVKTAIEETFESNVFEYGDRAVRRFRRNPGRREFDHVASMGDEITKPSVELTLRDDLWDGLRTELALKATGHVYAENDEKDFGRYVAELKQALGPADGLRFQVILEPDVFERTRRRIVSPRAFVKSIYDETKYAFRYSHRVNESLAVDGNYFYEWKDYNRDFEERDQAIHDGEVRAKISVTQAWWVRLGYAYETSEARGENTNPAGTVTDVGYCAHIASLDSGFVFSKKVDLGLGWEKTFKHYTSEDPFDVTRFERDDVRDEFRARLTWKPKAGMQTWMEFLHKENHTDLGLPHANGIFGYHDSQVSLGFELGF